MRGREGEKEEKVDGTRGWFGEDWVAGLGRGRRRQRRVKNRKMNVISRKLTVAAISAWNTPFILKLGVTPGSGFRD